MPNLAQRLPLTQAQVIDLALKAYAVTVHFARNDPEAGVLDFCDSLISDMEGMLQVQYAALGIKEYGELAERFQQYLRNVGFSEEVHRVGVH